MSRQAPVTTLFPQIMSYDLSGLGEARAISDILQRQTRPDLAEPCRKSSIYGYVYRKNLNECELFLTF